ncbi:MAG: signal peptidase I [Pyrinomonadaceae bacterium]
MFKFRQNDQLEFGFVSAADDPGIEIVDLRRESRNNLWYEMFRFVRDVLIAVMAFALLMVFVAQPVWVDGVSMVPYLENGERLIVNKLIYYDIKSVSWGHIERGDVVVFWYPRQPDKSFVKRVIGLPGETVSVRNGKVLIDGEELYEPYLEESENQSMVNRQPVLVDDYHYFVMGDNRDQSLDSRAWGLVPSKYIFGKAFFRFWRPSGFGFLPKEKPQLQGGKPDKEDYRVAN